MLRVRKQIGITKELIDSLPANQITVAVLDSGIATHPDLSGKVIAFADFVAGRKQPYDDNGHGTHVCGIICGSGRMSDGKYCGIAPKTQLVVGKVLNQKGEGSANHMLMGLRWIADICDSYNIKILNISVGIGELKESSKEEEFQKELEALWNKGITIVCAAGNKGPDENTLSAICSKDDIITVGCHDGMYCKDNPKRCETYSGRGRFGTIPRKPDIVAPGTDIVSCNVFYNREVYVKKSGTSMATPIVSGVLALALQKEPHLTNKELRQRITFSARDLGEPWNKQGWGMVDAGKMLW